MQADVSFEEAVEQLLEAVEPVSSEILPLEDCFARVLAESIAAATDVPPFDRSPYDGYALRARDTAAASAARPVMLQISEEVPAGSVAHLPVTSGMAVKILTGAPIPEGADAVIMFEKTRFTKTHVTLFAPVQRGENIVRAGEDIKKGTVIAEQGQRFDPGLLGSLAAQGLTAAPVFKRPIVGLISTGSELVSGGAAPSPGQVFDSNRYTLAGAIAGLGCLPVHYGIVQDDTASIRGSLEKAIRECDAVVLTGGVSVGDYDLTAAAMEQSGIDILFQGCRIKPGMACAYGVTDGKPICALSGNPASSLTNFCLLARPALLKRGGLRDCVPKRIAVTLADGFGKNSPVTRVLRGKLDLSDGTVKMRLVQDQGNVVLSSAIGCNALAIIPAGSGAVKAGTRLEAIVL